MRRRGRTTVTVDVDVYTDEVLADMEDSDLLDELNSRGLGTGVTTDDLEAIHEALWHGKPNHALALIEALMRKKPVAYYQSALERAKASRDPDTGRPLII